MLETSTCEQLWLDEVKLQCSVGPLRPSWVSFCSNGVVWWSILTSTMLCDMSKAAIGPVSLIYRDKCKHAKSQLHATRWHCVSCFELFGISSEYTMHTLCCSPSSSWNKAQHSPCVHLTGEICGATWMSRPNRSRVAAKKLLVKCHNIGAGNLS